ncbi:MAG TPA: RNA polymerase sigma factor [Cyclobacteriaceae bacterium]|nr:RNA polymerase sigma factor [Cyclobacteriaceae bacterium]
MITETLQEIAMMHIDGLVIRARNGDQKAFGKIMGLWFKRIYNFSNKYFGDHDLAMETTQKTFIAVYHNIRKLQDPAKFKTWIYKIAWNQCHEEERRINRKNWFSLFTSPEARNMPEYFMTPDKEMHVKEIGDLVSDILKTLPEEQKTIIILKEYEGLKFREIAEMLGISENTAKSRMYYALKSLRKSIEENNIDINSLLYGK